MTSCRFAAMLAIGALISPACGGGNSGGNVAAPTAPTAPTAQPPAVNVGGGAQTLVPWAGQASVQGGAGSLNLTLRQTGAQVTGTIYVQALAHSGPFTGVVSGNTLTFNFSVGNSGQGCGNAISGTASVSSVNMNIAPPNATNVMTGTFSGQDCSGGAVTNGSFTATLDPTTSTTRFPFAGTWKSPLPPSAGGGSWTWTLTQGGDVNGGNITGSVTFADGNTLNLGTGTITGTVTNTFPGPPNQVTAVTTATFTGACPGTLTVNWGTMSGDGLQFAGNVSGSSCNGSFSAMLPPTVSIRRQ